MTADRELIEDVRRRVGDRLTEAIADVELSGAAAIGGEDRRMLAHKLITEELQAVDARAMRSGHEPSTDETRGELTRSIINELFALGRIQQYIDDPDVSDIAINRYDTVWLTKRNGFKFQGEPVADSDEHLIEIIQTAARRGRWEHRWDPASPRLDLQLPSGDRLNAIAVVSLLTTAAGDDSALGSANATSAATAQASRLAARAMATYPDYWPETIRGLLTHSAEWTTPMRKAVFAETGKKKRRQLLRRYDGECQTMPRCRARLVTL